MRITIQQLLEKKACPKSVVKYHLAKGYDIDLEGKTVEVYRQQDYFDLKWLHDNFTFSGRVVFGKNVVEYDNQGLMTKKTNPDGGVTTYKYNTQGLMTKETNSYGDVWTWDNVETPKFDIREG